MNRYRALQADIVDRQYVGTKLVKDEEHFRRPAADAAHGEQGGDHVFVGHARQILEVQASGLLLYTRVRQDEGVWGVHGSHRP